MTDDRKLYCAYDSDNDEWFGPSNLEDLKKDLYRNLGQTIVSDVLIFQQSNKKLKIILED